MHRRLLLVTAIWVLGTAPGARAEPPAPATSRQDAGAVAHGSQHTGEDAPEPCVPKPRRPRVRVVLDGKVNLNTADAELLNMLPGVGRASAERIIERRERRPFRRPEELIRLKGFGARRFQQVRPYLSVTGPSTLRPVWTGLTARPEAQDPPPEPTM